MTPISLLLPTPQVYQSRGNLTNVNNYENSRYNNNNQSEFNNYNEKVPLNNNE